MTFDVDKFLIELYKTHTRERPTIRLVFDTIIDLLEERKFQEIDWILGCADPTLMSDAVSLSLLGITQRHKNLLLDYVTFRARVWDKILRQGNEEIMDQLFQGL